MTNTNADQTYQSLFDSDLELDFEAGLDLNTAAKTSAAVDAAINADTAANANADAVFNADGDTNADAVVNADVAVNADADTNADAGGSNVSTRRNSAAQDENMVDQLMRDSGFDKLIFDLTFGSTHGSSFRSSHDSEQNSASDSTTESKHRSAHDPSIDPAANQAVSSVDGFTYDSTTSQATTFAYDSATNFTYDSVHDPMHDFAYDSVRDFAASHTANSVNSHAVSEAAATDLKDDLAFGSTAPDDSFVNASSAEPASRSSAGSTPIIPRPYNPFAQLESTLLLDPFAPLLSGSEHSHERTHPSQPGHPTQPSHLGQPAQPATLNTLPSSPATFLGAPPNPMAPHKISPLATPRTTMRTHFVKTPTQSVFAQVSGLRPVQLDHTPLQAIPAHTPASAMPTSSAHVLANETPDQPEQIPARTDSVSTAPQVASPARQVKPFSVIHSAPAANSSCHQHLFRRSFRKSDAALPPLNCAARSQSAQSHQQTQHARPIQSGQHTQHSQAAQAHQHAKCSQPARNLRPQSLSAFQPLTAQSLSLQARPLRSSALPPLQSSTPSKPLRPRKRASLQQRPIHLESVSAVQRPVKTRTAALSYKETAKPKP